VKARILPAVRQIAFISMILILLAGCLPERESPLEELAISDAPSFEAPSVQVAENYYRGLQPFVTSETRGTLQTYLHRYRLDTERLELGMLEIAQERYPTDRYYFREGQFITRNELTEWLRPNSEQNPRGLNPEHTDRILLHILEHNYWSIQGDQPVPEGIVLGLSLAPTYTHEVVDVGSGQSRMETIFYSDDELRNHGMEMAGQLIQRLRTKVELPITIALYRVETNESLLPGNFLSVGYVEEGQINVSSWSTISEAYFLFPSRALAEFDPAHSARFRQLNEAVQDFFPSYVGVIGTGRYVDEKLVELTVQVTTDFASKTEVIQLTQFIAGKATDLFEQNIHLNVYIQSINKEQALFVRPIQGEPIMHIYRN
jgi:protein involved in sex pheromone biosynthesis